MFLRSLRHPDGPVSLLRRAGSLCSLLLVLMLQAPQRAEATLLSDLFAGDSLSAGSLTFDSWTLITNDSDVDDLDPSLIDVTASVIGNVVTLTYTTVGAPGPGTWFVDVANAFMMTEFSYVVTYTGMSPFITDAGLSIVGGFDFGTPEEDGLVQVQEDIAESGDLLEAIVDTAFMTDIQTDTRNLGAFSSLTVTTFVDLAYDGSPGDNPITLTDFTQTFTTPEPASLGMGAVALLGFGWLRRRERRPTLHSKRKA